MSKITLKLRGFRSGRLVGVAPHHQNARKQWFWLCQCDCGEEKVVFGPKLKDGRQKSCGCWRADHPGGLIHGLAKTPEHRSYMYARTRCNNPNTKSYKYYGGRGIQFRFASFEEFLAELGPKPSPRHSVDRINNNGHYEKGNVRWATAAEQNANKREKS